MTAHTVETASPETEGVTFDSEVAFRVREQMRKARVSQTLLGKRLGVHQTYMSRRVRGEVPFSIDELAAIAQIVDCPITAFLPERRGDYRYCINSLALDFEHE